ncbi:hypothetical protein M2132_000977 [Dysgonomonas sp. PH5-45]|nr:hypothetical protein [Dysgonomonas sp. PH5-45]
MSFIGIKKAYTLQCRQISLFHYMIIFNLAKAKYRNKIDTTKYFSKKKSLLFLCVHYHGII